MDAIFCEPNQIGDPRAVFVYDLTDSGVRYRGHLVNPVLRTSGLPETMPHPTDEIVDLLPALLVAGASNSSAGRPRPPARTAAVP